MTELNAPIMALSGVGPRFAERLSKLGIKTAKDLLWHFPFRYEDFSQVSKIAELKINEQATIQGVIQEIKLKRTWRRRMFIIEALMTDETGSIRAVWFNQRFLIAFLKKGRRINLAGKVQKDDKGAYFSHPIYELIGQSAGDFEKPTEEMTVGDFKHTGRLIPIYPETKRITSKALRNLVGDLLENLEKLEEPLPKDILEKYGFPELNQALFDIHFPKNIKEARIAKKRFSFEDLFLLQLANLRQRKKLARQKSYSFEPPIDYIKSLLLKLPFELTKSQKTVLWEVLKDFSGGHPMNRLLQGDVGSGKTIVAALAALIVAKNDKQSAFMAPTEVLAHQHYRTFSKFFPDFEKGIALLTSSEARIFYGDQLETETKKGDLAKGVSNGEIKIIIGTHALIQKYVGFKNLAFVVIDEQHRFGVRQRAELIRSQTTNVPESTKIKNKDTIVDLDEFVASDRLLPHFLSMSATPIPRTLSMTLFGNLDLSIIEELPKDRKEIITKIVAPANRDKAYAFIRGQVEKGRQAFVICPRIEPQASADDQRGSAFSPRQSALLWEVKAVKEEYEKLSQKVFPDLKVAMLHGKMKGSEKTEIMSKFKEGKINILVSTSVVEVGVDVPNATIMMIEGSERFGLAQLYQFRGRVGRGEYQSFCFLLTDSGAKAPYQRLQSLLEAKNGFELAEKDLSIRGPGEFLGESQTGMPDLAMKAVQNPELVNTSREEAKELLKDDSNLKRYPTLKKRLISFEGEIHLE